MAMASRDREPVLRLGATCDNAQWRSLSTAWRRAEVVEHSCAIGTLQMGETLENVSKNVDSYSYRLPLGVCAGVAPFNFPGMLNEQPYSLPLCELLLTGASCRNFVLRYCCC